MATLGKKKIASYIKIIKDAILLLDAVPEENWICYYFTNEVDKCCAIGHYQRLTSSNPSDYSFANCDDFNYEYSSLRIAYEVLTGCSLASINNWWYKDIATCKGRTLQALRDAVAKQESKLNLAVSK
jgi:hypothetical protein